MRILLVSSEAVPYAKTGGLADVAGAVPKSLRTLGHHVALILPYYRQTRERFGAHVADSGLRLPIELGGETPIAAVHRTTLPHSDVPVFLVGHPGFFDREQLYGTAAGDYPDNAERFIFFAKAVIEAVKALEWQADIYHCNDWQTALLPVYLKTSSAKDAFFHNSRSLLTIHNLAYQGVFPAETFSLIGLDHSHFNWREFEFYGKLNLLKGGIVYADLLNTVSKRYAQEIQTKEHGSGLEGILSSRAEDLYGIINGIDYSVWNPATDDLIPANYSPSDLSGKAVCKRELQKRCGLPITAGTAHDPPLLGLISRLDNQKGLDLVADIAEDLALLDVQLVLLGTGAQEYEERFAALGERFPSKFSINITFNNELAHQIEAGCDLYLMPSRYEPCGLNQLYSLKYGAIPIVRKTGGLADTITNCTPTSLAKETANGFSFASYSPRALLNTIKRALKLYPDRRAWRRLVRIAMSHDWSWEKSARQYLELYKKARG